MQLSHTTSNTDTPPCPRQVTFAIQDRVVDRIRNRLPTDGIPLRAAVSREEADLRTLLHASQADASNLRSKMHSGPVNRSC